MLKLICDSGQFLLELLEANGFYFCDAPENTIFESRKVGLYAAGPQEVIESQ